MQGPPSDGAHPQAPPNPAPASWQTLHPPAQNAVEGQQKPPQFPQEPTVVPSAQVPRPVSGCVQQPWLHAV
jgi:hypothetical protein